MGRNPRHRGDAGQDVVEYALVLPLLLLLLLGMVEFGWAVFAYDTVSNAAREVARCCIYPSEDPTQLSRCDNATQFGQCETAVIARFSTAVGLTEDDFAYTSPAAGFRRIRVDVTYDHRLITGYIAAVLGLDPATATFTFHTAATMGVE